MGYYMAARKYDISLRVLKNTSEIFFSTRREVSYLQEAMPCYIYYTNTTEIPNHFILQFLGVKGAIYCVAIATVIFHV